MKKEAKSAKKEKKETESNEVKTLKSKNCDVFDLPRIERLVELMTANELTEIELAQGKFRIQLRRGAAAVPVVSAAPVMSAAPAAAPVVSAAPASAAAAPQPAEDASSYEEIVSPMVGTFYASPSPDAAPFIQVGGSVGPESTVCIIEAMKVFNEIQAEKSGKIVAVLVKSGDPVEFGQPLFKIDTRG